MANFQKNSSDKAARLDTAAGRLVLMLEERVKIDLWGGGPGGEELIVDFSDVTIGSVSKTPVKRDGWLFTYEVQGLRSGDATLEARLFNQTPVDNAARRRLWTTMPVWASLKVTVMGAEYRQADPQWGNLKYGSTNPAWKNDQWTNMGEAGCGPTSLAIIMDFLVRLDSPNRNVPASFPGVDPKETMDYTSKHGRAADDQGKPSGTSGPTMISDIGKYWPDYEGRRVERVSEAAVYLRMGRPLVFLCKNCTTYKYGSNGVKQSKKWPGHFMVLLGVETDTKTFWITDPSLAHHKYISSDELQKNAIIWRISKKSNQ